MQLQGNVGSLRKLLLLLTLGSHTRNHSLRLVAIIDVTLLCLALLGVNRVGQHTTWASF
jgi:hypothetical protein